MLPNNFFLLDKCNGLYLQNKQYQKRFYNVNKKRHNEKIEEKQTIKYHQEIEIEGQKVKCISDIKNMIWISIYVCLQWRDKKKIEDRREERGKKEKET